MEKNMTALISCFSRAYHYKNNSCRIYSDSYAEKILTAEEYNMISQNMIKGIKFFNFDFKGTDQEALRWIVDKQLSPTVIGRSAFTEKALYNAVQLGCKQYLIFASGYDTSAYKLSSLNLSAFEIDQEEIIEDKKKRLIDNKIDISKVEFIKSDFTKENLVDNLINSSYNSEKISFSSLLGISYYLTKEEFTNFIKQISSIVFNGSSIAFDYPTYDSSLEGEKNELLAKAADEEMKAKYTYKEIEQILAANGLLIYEHLNSDEITKNYFEVYNKFNSKNKIIAPKGVNYCLAIKKMVI